MAILDLLSLLLMSFHMHIHSVCLLKRAVWLAGSAAEAAAPATALVASPHIV